MSVSIVMGLAFLLSVLSMVYSLVRYRRSKILAGASTSSRFSTDEIEANALLLPVLYRRGLAERLTQRSTGPFALLDLTDPRHPTLHRAGVAKLLPPIDSGSWSGHWTIIVTELQIVQPDTSSIGLVIRSGFQREALGELKYRPVWKGRLPLGFTRIGR